MQFIYVFLLFFPFLLFSTDNPSSAYSRLVNGNKRFLKGETEHPSLANEAKIPTLENAGPVAVIVGCSDARVPPEIIFDQGLGDLFVIRVAGNVIGPIELDSVEFAVARLNAPLVIVLGHQNCKAVETALKGREHVPELKSIYPLIDNAFKKCEIKETDPVTKAIDCNVQKGVAVLKRSEVIAPLIQKNKVKIVGAYYNVDNGTVRFLDEK